MGGDAARRRVGLLLLPALLLTAAPATAQPAARLQAFLAGLQSFAADFQQVLLSEFEEPLEVSAGQARLTRDGRFLWRYTRPYSQQIVSDGEAVWIYDEDLRQVTINRAAALEDTPLAIFSGRARLDERYDITAAASEDGIEVIDLRPRAAATEGDGLQYSKIRFALRGDELLSLVLHDALGQITNIEFSNARRNAPLDEGLFRFTIPNGVDVIDNRAVEPEERARQ